MTELERKEAKLKKLYDYRAAASRSNDVMWLRMNESEIDRLEKEIIALRKGGAN